MAAADVTYQISALSHGGTSITEPVGASMDEIIQFLAVIFGANVWTQISPIQNQQIEAETVSLNLAAELTQGAKGTLSIALKQAGGTTLTTTITNMLFGSRHRDMNSAPYQKRMHFLNEGTPVVSITSA